MYDPINPNLQPEARSLLKFFYKISGNYILSGQHNFPGTISHYTERVKELTGKYPAIWGQDFGFTADGKDGIIHRPRIMEEAIKQHSDGSIITLMWHAVSPLDNEPNGWHKSVQRKLTSKQWNELITPGSQIHSHWLSQIDMIAEHLKILCERRIPVLWRPYHEMNGMWFWWGNRPGKNGFEILWKMIYRRFTDFHQLNNLIWVWNANYPLTFGLFKPSKQFEQFFPGLDWADILSTDVYHFKYDQQDYEDLVKLAAKKPISLAEVGKLPSVDILRNQPLYTWFMVWTDHLEEQNRLEDVQALYSHPRVLTRENLAEKFQDFKT